MSPDLLISVRSYSYRVLILASLTLIIAILFIVPPFQQRAHAAGNIAGCPMFPADNPWNQDITNWPVDPNSANYVSSVGATNFLHPDFGSDPTYGIPYVVVNNSQVSVPITYDGAPDESDPGPFPIPLNAPVEGAGTAGDQHVLVVNSDTCRLYELDFARQIGPGWTAYSGATWDLTSNVLRPAGWTSADAAGLPILPGLVRYDEVTAGAIQHALRFTVQNTQKAYVYPARHYASSSTNPNLPPMGLRFRLKASYDISLFTGQSRTIAQALKTYGMMVADNGSNWYVSGSTDTRWDDNDLDQLKHIPGSAFEVVVMPPNAPSGLSATATSQTEIDLTWTDNAFDETAYKVERSPDGTHWAEIASLPANTTSYQSMLLDCNTAYQYRVRAYRGTDHIYSDYSTAATATTQSCSLGSVTLIAPASAVLTNNNSPLFSWTATTGAAAYELQIDTHSDFSSPARDMMVSALSGSPDPLLDGTTYSWRVRGLAGSNSQAGAWSAAWTISIDRVRLAPPTLSAPLDSANIAILTPVFTWLAVTNATQYRLQLGTDPAFGSSLFTKTFGNVTSYATKATDGLQYGLTYYWRMQAGDASNVWSNSSSTKAFTTTIQATPADGAYSTTTTPTFTWSAVPGATSYQVQVSSNLDFAPAHIEASNSGTVLQYIILSGAPLNYGLHYWHVSVTTSGGAFTMQPWALTVTTALPPAPTLIGPATGTVTALTTPTLSWNTVTAAGGPFTYQVQIATASTFYGPVQDIVQSGTSYPAQPLTPDGVYYWRARAINVYNTTGAWSAVNSITIDTTPPPIPAPVTPANWSDVTIQPVRLTWAASTGAKYYTVQLFGGTNCGTNLSNTQVLSPTTSYATTLVSGMYCWNVRAGDAQGNWSAASPTFHFTVSNPAITPSGTPTLTGPTSVSAWPPAGLPALTWSLTGSSGNTFEVQIDTSATFAHPVQDVITSVDQFSYSVSPLLSSGTYSWHVRAINLQGVGGMYSAARTFSIQSVAPNAPMLLNPANNASTTSLHPTLTWQAVANAKTYLLQVASDSGFASLLVNNQPITALSVSYAMTAQTLAYGSTYYWRIQAIDSANNSSPWSTPFQFTVSVHSAPGNGSATTLVRPTFVWQAVTGASQYQLNVASDSGFSNIVASFSGLLTSYTIPSASPALGYGTYYWHVAVTTSGGTITMPAWTVIVTPNVPSTPVLAAPATSSVTNDNTPTFTWKAALNAQTYEIQIATVATFANPQVDASTAPGALFYTPTSLPDAIYYWRVRSLNTYGVPSVWSAAWTLTVDTQAPAAPTLIGPADGTTTTNPSVTLRWNASTGAVRYEVALANVNPPQARPIAVGNVLTYVVPSPLPQGQYYWEVRAIDAAGNVSAWSAVRSFILDAGLKSQPAKPTPPPDQQALPQSAPTYVPPSDTSGGSSGGNPPAATPSPIALVTIEAEGSSVQRTGNWTAQTTSKASGGSYLYSSGHVGDSLSLGFTGSQVEIVFIEHPAFGSFAIEVDGQVKQTVNAQAPQVTFGARISIGNLGAGQHVLRVYAIQGTVALDAFRVESVVSQ